MKLTPGRLLLAGAALVVVTNAIALGGAAYNRRAPADSELTLSSREFVNPADWAVRSAYEESGRSLQLQWTVRMTDLKDGREETQSWIARGGYASTSVIPWLDETKLRALGIPPPSARQRTDGRYPDGAHPGRDVYLVLEMNGPGYAAALRAANDWVATTAAAAAEHPGDPRAERAAASARQSAARLAETDTRLYVVDAGRDPGELRGRYPDRARYALVRGHVRSDVARVGGMETVTGRVTAVRADVINVPLEFRHQLEALRSAGGPAPAAQAGELAIVVRFGRRFEPWLQSVAAAATDAAPADPRR